MKNNDTSLQVPRARSRYRRQGGQSLIGALALMFVIGAATFLLYNTAQTTTEKTRLVNAADAAAYSGATWVAQQLNFVAYTNRAMVANHILVGHFVAYASWIDYVESAMDTALVANVAISFVIPIAALAIPTVSALEKVSEALDRVNGDRNHFGLGHVFVKSVDVLNGFLSSSQALARLNVQGSIDLGSGSSPLHQVMAQVAGAHSHSNQIRVNHASDLQGQLAFEVASQQAALAGFLYRSSPSRLNRITPQSFGASEPWLTDRRWDAGLLKKRQTSRFNAHGWSAKDKLKLDLPLKDITLGRGGASSREYRYAGLPRYLDMNSNSSTNTSLILTAVASTPFSATRAKQNLGFAHPVARIAASSRAQVHYVWPEAIAQHSSERAQYPNVYNPFWIARLAPKDGTL